MRQPWMDAEVDALREFVLTHQPRSLAEWEPLAKALARTVHSCRTKAKVEGIKVPAREIRYAGLRAHDGPVPAGRGSEPETATPPSPPSLHVKKLHVHVPREVTKTQSDGLVRAVVFGDTHVPHQDRQALELVGQVIRVVGPDVVVHVGDLCDAYHLSRFDKDPSRIHGLQRELDEARQILASFRVLAPKARFVLLEGNHEDRLRRAMWSMPPHAQALTQLDVIKADLTWPKLLGLEDLDIEFYPYGEQSKANIFPKWIVKHGSIVRTRSGYTAHAEHTKYGRSGSSGHTHRLSAIFHRDHNGNHCWTETGCTCSLNPEYAEDPDWQQGCLVLTFEPVTGAFQAEPVYIHHGTMLFRGVWYDARTP